MKRPALKWFALALLSITLIPLLGCNTYRPVYAQNEAQASFLSSISVLNIPDREGQHMRNVLISELTPEGHASSIRYKLEISLEEDTIPVSINPEGDIVRAQLDQRAHYKLIDAESGEVVKEGTARVLSPYHVTDYQYAARKAEDDARRLGLEFLAGEIQTQLTLYCAANCDNGAE